MYKTNTDHCIIRKLQDLQFDTLDNHFVHEYNIAKLVIVIAKQSQSYEGGIYDEKNVRPDAYRNAFGVSNGLC